MKRRPVKGLEYAQDGPHGRPAAEIRKRWASAAKRHMHKLERRQGREETRKQADDR